MAAPPDGRLWQGGRPPERVNAAIRPGFFIVKTVSKLLPALPAAVAPAAAPENGASGNTKVVQLAARRMQFK
ncbi:hypothetical protein R69919_04577 [Paraburkholderia gardini]|nr:hypothetical protein R69919_04577 [Paraburkholderia gardini]